MKLFSIFLPVALTLFVASTGSAQEKKTNHPNVLMICVDDLNDWLGCMDGHPNAYTPNIDRLASKGMLFANAHCQAPICGPSRASIMTGLRPSTTGIYGQIDDHKISTAGEATKDIVFLPEYFKSQGYYTMGKGKIFHEHAPENVFDLSAGREKGFGPMPEKPFHWDKKGTVSDWGAFPATDEQMPDYRTAKWAVERLQQKYEKPFFLVAGFVRPHVPWHVPQKWFDLHPLDRVRTPPYEKDDLSDLPSISKEIHDMPMMPSTDWAIASGQWKHIVQAYLACVSFVDHYIGEVLNALENSPYKDNTIVILWSDHGYRLGEKGAFAKHALWQEATNAPLIISMPNGKTVGKCDAPVEMLDIYPTLLDLCGLPANPRNEGKSLQPLMKNPTQGNGRYAVTTYGRNNHAVVSNGYRYIQYEDGSEELYHRKSDPNEFTNIAGKIEHQKVKTALAKLLPVKNENWSPQIKSGANAYFEKQMKTDNTRPNILFVIADDQSYPYASAYGNHGVHTPAFDRVAERGILFTNAFVAAPQCSPSRAAILTGKNIWELEEAGTHSSYFPKKFTVFTDVLEQNGYAVGYTGKAWGPGNWKDAGWSINPVGPEYNDKVFASVPTSGISKIDYFENFKTFYAEKKRDAPFFFWYGGHEPHRDYEKGSGVKAGKKLSSATVPGFLPDTELVESDVLDYTLEIEWFDAQLAKMLDFLEEKGELDNTMIVVTADNGMPFPSAKANLLEYGTHVPLAICWPKKIKGKMVISELVSMIDLAPTFLDINGIQQPQKMTGKSLSHILFSNKKESVDSSRTYVLTGRERHTHARPDNLGYPARAIRTSEYLYVWNIAPDRWPAGDPAPKAAENTANEKLKNLLPGYHDVDDSPTKTFLLEEKDRWRKYAELAYSKRPAYQLFNIKEDPFCVNNLAENPAYKAVKTSLHKLLMSELKKQGDPRVLGTGHIFESYPRFGAMRDFPGFKEKGTYNPAFPNNQKIVNQ